ncbi:MAG TPA: phenylphosphate carboxylase subunit delta [Deltaproteobacteria bacterium]|nr:MAG: phenylphosphate carboxylase subunit delta [Deltaproteobacteria bacterium GWA2_55_82]OGQ62220.1 MAG: phenylphosphate carboxylase subunit delta [Deltaproteobacteria bacterium RIFCSPLOWO2_02_FULL_55_12]OIJ73262.1 MAG: phenylphosphate carboxylase subunit delta [Deltaproteobacteria bacterium GWC2_55_46]HBG45474.1 phenylphosphate carboxylase subunit delta [Deltaproteobacteria bacterium]HCY10305.1 phenylphosphate carboxylase subunit delta [Deltaproteobacteria bacterium]
MSAVTFDEKIKQIKLVIFDVDGVLTDGRIIFDAAGVETKCFDVKDGHGIKLLIRSGIQGAIITARESEVVLRRAKDLGIDLVYQGIKDKRLALDDIVAKSAIPLSEMAYMGDDIIDIPVLKRVGFSATVADGVEEVRGMVDYVARRPGGRGAARELVELILKAQGKWDEVMRTYLV